MISSPIDFNALKWLQVAQVMTISPVRTKCWHLKCPPLTRFSQVTPRLLNNEVPPDFPPGSSAGQHNSSCKYKSPHHNLLILTLFRKNSNVRSWRLERQNALAPSTWNPMAIRAVVRVAVTRNAQVLELLNWGSSLLLSLSRRGKPKSQSVQQKRKKPLQKD